MDICYFKSLALWQFGTAAAGNEHGDIALLRLWIILKRHVENKWSNPSGSLPRRVPSWVFNVPFYYSSRLAFSDSATVFVRKEILTDVLTIASLSSAAVR